MIRSLTMVHHILTVTMLGVLSGCFGPSHPSHFYLLGPTVEHPQMTGERPGSERVIEIGPLILAKYLDRSNLVSRSGTNVVIVSDFHAWAEPLPDLLLRAVAQNIDRAMDPELARGAIVRSSAFMGVHSSDLQVPITVEQFDCNERRECTLAAHWLIRAGEEPSPLHTRIFTKSASAEGTAAEVATLSELVGELSTAIYSDLRAALTQGRARKGRGAS